MAGIYIHIPFCKTKCNYCAFFSKTRQDEATMERYVDAMMSELAERSHYLKGERVETVYLGGGTPSVLPLPLLERLVKGVIDWVYINNVKSEGIKDEARRGESTLQMATGERNEKVGRILTNGLPIEFTIECNPDDIDEEHLDLFASLPINRVSMGVQTFSEHYLKWLGRRHDNDEVAFAVDGLRRRGISNISLDLMYGFPSQTLEDIDADIDNLLRLRPSHISTYCLSYEEDTPLWRQLQRGDFQSVSDEEEEEMYYHIVGRLKAAGYDHYELSNFALPGCRAIHNSSYWSDTPYLGIGAAAHSYDGESRQWNVADVKKYIEGYFLDDSEQLSIQEKYNDMITTALRTSDGVSAEFVEKKFGSEICKRFVNDCETLVDQGLLEKIAPSSRCGNHEFPVPADPGFSGPNNPEFSGPNASKSSAPISSEKSMLSNPEKRSFSFRISSSHLFVSDAIMRRLIWVD